MAKRGRESDDERDTKRPRRLTAPWPQNIVNDLQTLPIGYRAPDYDAVDAQLRANKRLQEGRMQRAKRDRPAGFVRVRPLVNTYVWANVSEYTRKMIKKTYGQVLIDMKNPANKPPVL